MDPCEHEETRLTRMTHCNQIKHQCQHCGQSVGNAISHNSIPPEQLASLHEFDYEFRDLMSERRAEERIQISHSVAADAQAKLQERKALYEDHLASDKWKNLRRQVISREQGICQGCRQNQIQDIHHMSYDHLGDELLFELIGLCRECHKKTHGIES